MARIRSIKPDFFVSEQLAGMPFEWRLLFVGLWTQADKAGRLEDRPLRLKAALFPYDDLDVNDGLGRLANAGLITRYEQDGRKLIAIPTWDKHQRPHATEPESLLPAPDRNGCLTVPKIVEGKGRDPDQEGNDPDPANALRARFESFWAVYPRKTAKDAAWAIWTRKKPDKALTDAMVQAVKVQAQSAQWQKDGGQFIPHARTWLNQGRWQDHVPANGPRGDGLDGLREFVRG